ncbi:hypothetical protein BYT27DRAFT_7135337 [Phlegmacium glaucopus]|nr:hypothetical protein BYT27DRAFT_7135337 [Phlegmacium glaucopus]
MIWRSVWYTLCFVLFAKAQTCENDGLLNGTSCVCPTGFGGSTCSQLGCGGTIFQGSQRPLTPSVSTGSFANLTASTCQCESGWIGMGCNVCQTANACQSGFTAAGQVAIDASTFNDLQGNKTLVCNTKARVWASSQMSCQVNNPTLQAIYPLSSTLNIIRTLQPGFSPIPNSTSFGVAGSAFAQLFYDGVEQFYCSANSCTQQLGSTDGSAVWQCSNLQCKCRPGTTFCGAVPATNLTATIDTLVGTLEIDCGAVDNSTNTATCNFKQATLQNLFGSNGLALNGCSFGECVQQGVIDIGNGSTSTQSSSSTPKSLSAGVIAGLAVVGGLILLSLFFLLLGLRSQRAARKGGFEDDERSKVSVEWSQLSYIIPGLGKKNAFLRTFRKVAPDLTDINDDKVILDNVNGKVRPGQMMAILGPSGAGKTTLVEILSGKNKSGIVSGRFSFPSDNPQARKPPRVGFVPQQDILPPTLTVFEAVLFAARLRLPENITDAEKHERVNILLEKLGIDAIKNARIGDITGGRARGISGGEMRRVSIGLELIACPDVLLLDEPTSGLDSVSAARVADILHAIAHDPVNPTPIIASIHQPSSQLYQKFDLVVLLSHGRALYSGPGGFAPAEYFSNAAPGTVAPYQKGYNVAEYLLEVANDPPVSLFQMQQSHTATVDANDIDNGLHESVSEKALVGSDNEKRLSSGPNARGDTSGHSGQIGYATTFLTQLQHLCGREWKTLKRDKTLFVTHVAVASILGVFCGGLYFNTNTTIAGFQSRVGCLFFLGALIAFSSLSALYNIVEVRPLFLRERSGEYYSPTAWLLSRFIFDMIPLRLIPTIIVSTVTYWMAGLSPNAAHFFKFLLMLVLYSLAMTLYNFLLGTFFKNGGIAILLSALSALYQMTFAGFFLHLNSIPPVLRWLQWLCPLKYNLEALSVNEVDSGLQIVDVLQGVPVNISAIVIMNLLFGFELNNYYRDILVMVGFILGFGIAVIAVVWFTVRERK